MDATSLVIKECLDMSGSSKLFLKFANVSKHEFFGYFGLTNLSYSFSLACTSFLSVNFSEIDPTPKCSCMTKLLDAGPRSYFISFKLLS